MTPDPDFDVDAIKSLWPEFRVRDEQIRMSEFISKGLQSDSISLIEAGTGVGKTLAYLLPALQYLGRNTHRILISTQTRALQEQIINKDLPMAQKIAGTNFVAEICMGAGNYLCKRRLQEALNEGKIPVSMTKQLDSFLDMEARTQSGLYSEFGDVVTPEFWSNIRREKDECLSRLCPNYASSYYFLAREKWKDARILIVNHSLLSSHYAFNEMLLPETELIIIDEAHNFPDTFHRVFANESSSMDLLRLVYSLGQGYGALLKAIEVYRNWIIKTIDRQGESRINIESALHSDSLDQLILEISKAEEVQSEILDQTKAQALPGLESEDLYTRNVLEMRHRSRLQKLNAHKWILEAFKQGPGPGDVHWIQTRKTKDSNGLFPVLHMSPLESGNLINEKFFATTKKAVLTSATLCTDKYKPFLYQAELLGLHKRQVRTLQLNSPFDYKSRVLLFVPADLPEPSAANSMQDDSQNKMIIDLVNMTKGGAFVLFTSRQSLLAAKVFLQKNLKSLQIYSQLDDGGAAEALFKFRKHPNSVLLGLATFWQGVDVIGDQLRLVIITRLPFRVPDEPLLAAKIKQMQQKNQNPFMQLQLPQAIISLKQGFGRLMRSEEDKGIVAILDSRLLTRRYGNIILDSLPQTRRISDIRQLQTAWQQLF